MKNVLTAVCCFLAGSTVVVLGRIHDDRKNNKTQEIKMMDIEFGPCENEQINNLSLGIECAMVQVPLDYNNDRPNAKKIDIAVSRLLHTDEEDYRGVVFTNPGGPGGAGRLFASIGVLIDPVVGAKYDWIGYDMRGAGESKPSLDCGYLYSNLGKPPYGPEFVSEWLARGKEFADACYRSPNNKELLHHMSNANHARDLERLRKAVGADRLNFYAFSYGTYVAQLYATMYPTTVGKFILDSAVDFNKGSYENQLDLVYGVDRAFQKFLEWTASFDVVYGLGTNVSSVEDVFYGIIEELKAYIQVEGIFGPAEFVDLMVNSILDQSLWPNAALLMNYWVNDIVNRAILTSIVFDPTLFPLANIIYAGFFSIVCRDNVTGGYPSYAEASLDYQRAFTKGATRATYPIAEFYMFPCFSWPVGPEEYYQADRNYDAEMLLFHLEFDANTDFQGATAVRDLFRKSVLVEVPGEVGHAKSMFGEQPCLDRLAAQYLENGTLPERNPARGVGVADLFCEGNLPPVPDVGGSGRRLKVESEKQQHIRQILRSSMKGYDSSMFLNGVL